ncbi:hypothetical protein EDB84DRAFT_1433146 [Lactarius hengduanensis]|nr:hypothetical protein EDB84DRAFT_1433146 [Lactarius hengduanensis]
MYIAFVFVVVVAGCIGATWRGLGAPCWVGVAVSCVPGWGGVGVGGGCPRGGSAGSWHAVLGWGGNELAGGRVLRAVSGWRGWWWLGLAYRVEGAWRVGGVLRIVLRQHGIVGCCVPYWGGVVPSSSLATSSILCSHGIGSHVGVVCWGGGEWRWLRWLVCTRRRQWPAMLKLWGWSAWNNGVVVREEHISLLWERNGSTTHIPTPQIKPLLDTIF